jgi:eukaryotic translation initiation factor 2C
VLDIELDALKKACRNKEFVGYNPLITFLVVQKRHHTRFFPQKRDGDGSKNNNVLAGTVVDTEITHPTELDFYLVSHKSIQVCARYAQALSNTEDMSSN